MTIPTHDKLLALIERLQKLHVSANDFVQVRKTVLDEIIAALEAPPPQSAAGETDVTPEAVAYLQNKANEAMKGGTWKQIDPPASSGGERRDVLEGEQKS